MRVDRMRGNFSVLKDFIVAEKEIIIDAQGMCISPSGKQIYKREHD